MTILVGMACSDGVLVGADSMVSYGETFATGGFRPTIRHNSPNKIEIDGDVISASSGQVGMGQRFKQALDEVVSSPSMNPKTMAPMRLGEYVSREWNKTLKRSGAMETDLGALVAVPSKSGPALLEFDKPDYQPEVKNAEFWHTSLGGGLATADPLLGLVRRMFAPTSQPDMRTGLLCMCFVLKLTCEIAGYGVGDPIHVASLTERDGARMLTREELEEHQQNVERFIEYGGKFLSLDASAPQAPRPTSA